MSESLLEHAIERLRLAKNTASIPCKVCGGQSELFDVVDLNKSCDPGLYPAGLEAIPVFYRMCSDCQFTFTDFFEGFTHEQWSRYVYNEDYVRVDPEYLEIRPHKNARDIMAILQGQKDNVIGLDYGGGNGRTSFLLREEGWTFDSYDPFGLTDVSPDRIGRYNFCSAMEVFEHVPDPVASISDILAKASPKHLVILIGTQILDGSVSRESRLSWWYAAPRNGHVSLYSQKSLKSLASKFGLDYQCVRGYPHLLTSGVTRGEAVKLLLRYKMLRIKMRFRS